MYGITNLLIKLSEEVPIFDGSAIEICRKIDEAGLIDQDAGIEPLKITDKIELPNLPDGKSLCIEPSDKFEIEYVLEQTQPIGRQTYSFCASKEAFIAEIAPARTFGFFKDFDQLTKLGLGSGARVNNVILLIDDGAVNTKLRFPDEFVRHKVLDLIGDTYLLNRPILGKITAKQTGHLEDIALVRELQKRYL
jgi:UDP-3-O-acyl-N-acetylglucosamine deacetylase